MDECTCYHDIWDKCATHIDATRIGEHSDEKLKALTRVRNGDFRENNGSHSKLTQLLLGRVSLYHVHHVSDALSRSNACATKLVNVPVTAPRECLNRLPFLSSRARDSGVKPASAPAACHKTRGTCAIISPQPIVNNGK